MPIGARLVAEYRTVNGHRAGPYYCARFSVEGQAKAVYVGSKQKKRELELAWEVVGEELAAAEASPAVRRLRELEARAGKLARTSAVIDVPILEVRRRPK